MMTFLSAEQFARLSEAERAQLLPLGYHPGTNHKLYLPEVDRYAGTYVLGVQGTGKSAFLTTPIHHDCKVGNAVIVIDPHGDLVDHIVAGMPKERLNKTYVLNLEDEGYPFGLNLFALSGPITSEQARAQAVERIMHIFEVLWPEVMKQAHLPRYLRAATHVFLDSPGATLVDMLTFLQDPQFRARLLRNVTDPTVKQFWRNHDGLVSRDQETRVQSLISKLESLFMGRALVRNVVGQRKTTVSFRRAIDNREAILIKLPVKQTPQDARLIGTILLAQISAAIFSYGDVPQAQRPGLSLYVDEASNYGTSDFSALFAEGRKFGARITIAHQWRSQLPDFLQDSTMSAWNKIIFRTTPEDSREMAHLFPAQEQTVDPESLNTNMSDYMPPRASDFPPNVQTFINLYLRQLDTELKQGNRGKVDLPAHLKVNWLYGGMGMVNDWVDDPTPPLNNLLRRCMKEGHANFAIPWEVAIGFSTCNGGFFPAIKHRDNPKLSPSYQFPGHLVRGGQWIRKPEGNDERLICFLFHLRQTMEYLAKNPVGKKSAASTATVAQWISQLPRRMAYVRTGDEIGMFNTLDMPAEVTGNELQQRVAAVQAQTRAKYCHSVAQVNQVVMMEPDEAFEPVAEAGVGKIAGWGRVGEP